MKKADRIDKCQWIDLKKGLTVRLELSWNFMLCVVLWKKKKSDKHEKQQATQGVVSEWSLPQIL